MGKGCSKPPCSTPSCVRLPHHQRFPVERRVRGGGGGGHHMIRVANHPPCLPAGTAGVSSANWTSPGGGSWGRWQTCVQDYYADAAMPVQTHRAPGEVKLVAASLSVRPRDPNRASSGACPACHFTGTRRNNVGSTSAAHHAVGAKKTAIALETARNVFANAARKARNFLPTHTVSV